MTTVFDVAKYILEHTGKTTTWKLQKLCYYAQAWTLAWEGSPLFDEDFQAQSNGPVCPDLYKYHQGMFSIEANNLPIGDSSMLTANQQENIDIILKEYGHFDPYALREQTHAEDPWKNARGNTPDGERSTAIITKESMGEYYASL